MITSFRLSVVVVLIIIFVFILYATNNAKLYNNNIAGFYEGCDDFMEKSELNEIYFYLAPSLKSGSMVMINSDNETVENTTFKIDISKKRYVSYSAQHAIFDCKIHNTVLPTNLKISFSFETGKMIIYDKDKIYAILIKDLKSTHAAFLALKGSK
jgi:hypothetical protein